MPGATRRTCVGRWVGSGRPARYSRAEGEQPMVCKMVKKGIVGAALGAGALALLFGTSAPSYIKTAFCKVRQTAKGSVPIQFEIDRARQEVVDLEPAIHQNLENLTRAEVDAEHLQAEIVATRDN